MPIYEYRCTACGHKLEALQKFSDAPLVDCPQCAQPGLTKLVSAAGFHLKGSGWYQTDFRGGGSKAPAASPTAKGDGEKSAGDPADKTAAKTESPAAKSETAAPPASSTPAA
jgi:putative FmdB family regulatory protein